MFYLLIAIIIILLAISLKLFDFEIICPPIAMLLMFLFSEIVGLFAYEKFGYSTFQFKTIIYMTIGFLSYIGCSYLAKYIVNQKENGISTGTGQVSKAQKRIEYPAIIYILVLAFELVLCISFEKFAVQLVTSYGLNNSNFLTTSSSYRIISTSADYDFQMPAYLRYGLRLIEIAGTYLAFIFFYNFSIKKLNWKDALCILGVVFWLVSIFLRADRGTMLNVMACLICLLYFFSKRATEWSKKTDIIMVSIGGAALVLYVLIFPFMTIFMGRDSVSGAIAHATDTILVYVSSATRAFDLYLQNPVTPAYFGQELFAALFKSLHTFFGIGENTVRHLEMVYYADLGTNIYTCFRRFYTIGGIFGILFFSGLEGFLYTFGYEYNKVTLQKGQVVFNIILFSYMSPGLFFMPIDDIFYSTYVSVGFPARVLLMYLIYRFFLRGKINASKVA